ncbi:MAG: hypothetical protein M0Z49_06495 [Chloroflexi bacterium]|nr:hypothetical protein [Chloroflexota bacterium]
MPLKLYRPGPEGLEPSGDANRDYRTQLRSGRWRLPPLANPEARPLDTLSGLLFFGSLLLLSFVILLVGYGVGFWH